MERGKHNTPSSVHLPHDICVHCAGEFETIMCTPGAWGSARGGER